ncbi:hypothetical protein [Listeria booriae]|uniref:ABC transporter permease n=1 Tax=Listeria booriae TaxID=1552123 RepID=A0A841YQ07_9LIST|nr:hypothetical protein [Listeria booriae]MBC1402605.1 hypothetical protein [Listeria booriae]MBC1616849.1 hypothetical protein [Listeria booriae]
MRVLFNKHIWLKEFRSVRWILLALMVMFLYAQTGGLYSDTRIWEDQYNYFQSDSFSKDQEQSADDAKLKPEDVKETLTLNYFTTGFPGDHYQPQYTMSQSYFALSVLVALLGLALVAWERYTRKDHFTLATPFKRVHIIGTKILLGAFGIIVSYGISLWLGLMHMFSVIPSEYIDLDMKKVYLGLIGNLGTFLLIFILAVFLGTVMGELLSTVVAIGVIAIMPSYVYTTWMVFMQAVNPNVDISKLANWTSYMNVFIVFGNSDFEYGPFVVQMILIALLIVGAIFFYHRYSVESNGKIFVFPYMRIPSALLISFGGAILLINFWVNGRYDSTTPLSLTELSIFSVIAFLGCLAVCYAVLYRNAWMRK